jgi:TPR repeat protein
MVASASPAETPATPPTKSAEDESAKTPDEDAASAQPAESEATPPTTAPDANEPAPAMTAPPTPAPKPKPEVKVASPPTPVLKGDDKLVAEGEKYLYGNGVPENCDLAQKNLKLAAAHANAHALTLMGAMYATGHCVDRDLPTAYRWFAKALRQDPSNARVQQDLEILWKQMTPGEKQLATKSGG